MTAEQLQHKESVEKAIAACGYPIRCTFTEEEESKITMKGMERNAGKTFKGKDETHIIGIGGEYVIQKLLGGTLDEECHGKHGDGNSPDNILLNGTRVYCKTLIGEHRQCFLPVKCLLTVENPKKDIVIITRYDDSNGVKRYLLGYQYIAAFIEKCKIENYHGKPAFTLFWDQFMNIRPLMDLLKVSDAYRESDKSPTMVFDETANTFIHM